MKVSLQRDFINALVCTETPLMDPIFIFWVEPTALHRIGFGKPLTGISTQVDRYKDTAELGI